MIVADCLLRNDERHFRSDRIVYCCKKDSDEEISDLGKLLYDSVNKDKEIKLDLWGYASEYGCFWKAKI